MFFVVFLTNIEVNVVVPIEWVYNLNDQWQKFINSGLNSNQLHRVFYTENSCAYMNNQASNQADGEPIPNYENLDFTLNADSFPDEGCYCGKLIKFFVDYDKAVEYAMKRRVVDPAVYNVKRLNQHPLPDSSFDDFGDLSIEDGTSNENSTANEESHIEQSNAHDGNPDENSLENSSNEFQTETSNSSHNLIEFDSASSQTVAGSSHTSRTQIEGADENQNEGQLSILNDFDPLAQENSTGVCHSDNNNSEDGLFDIACGGSQIENVVHTPTELVVKIEPIIPDEDVLNELISEPEYTFEQVDDDIQIIFDNKIGFAKPFYATANSLVKRENDVISGCTPFDELKNGNRLYKLGEFHLEVPARVLGTIKEWNTRSDRNTPKYDGRLIQVLLLLCMEIENVTENDIIEFVQGFILYRAKDDSDRIAFMEEKMRDTMHKK